jgi:4-hydroxybenzoyl-CoA reductase subunit beta
MNEVSFVLPETVTEASRLFSKRSPSEAVFMAGGTDLLVLRRQSLIAPRAIIYLKMIPALSEIRYDEKEGLKIGAMATLDEVVRHGEINRHYPMLARAALSVGSPQIRHKATIGGNICLNSRCWFYNRSPFWRKEYSECRKASGGRRCYVLQKSRKGCFALQSGDTVGPLVALGAKVRLVSERGERVLPVEDFFLGDGMKYLALEPDEILTEILLPPPSRTGVFLKFRPQNNLDFATFTLSVLPRGKGTESRIVVGSVASRPLRAEETERMLDQGTGDAAAVARKASEELKLVSFVRGAVEFKRKVIEAKLTDILKSLEDNLSL